MENDLIKYAAFFMREENINWIIWEKRVSLQVMKKCIKSKMAEEYDLKRCWAMCSLKSLGNTFRRKFFYTHDCSTENRSFVILDLFTSVGNTRALQFWQVRIYFEISRTKSM